MMMKNRQRKAMTPVMIDSLVTFLSSAGRGSAVKQNIPLDASSGQLDIF